MAAKIDFSSAILENEKEEGLEMDDKNMEEASIGFIGVHLGEFFVFIREQLTILLCMQSSLRVRVCSGKVWCVFNASMGILSQLRHFFVPQFYTVWLLK